MTRWQKRIERAVELEKQHPSAAAMLRFYRQLATFQSDPRIGPNVEDHVPALLNLVRRAGVNPVEAFLVRAIEQPYFERQALQAKPDTTTVQPACPFCFEKPAVAILRPERSLQCGRCFTEWAFRRLLCPSCGEEDRDKLPVYTAPEFPHIRVEACDTCRHYIKAVDLSRDGHAIPEVDDIAALPLDLWALEQDYERLTPNLFL